MNVEKIREAVIKANCFLELDRKIIGVKFLFTEEEFEKAEAKPINSRMYYCGMVKSAMAGNSIKVAGKYFACLGGARAIGVIQPEEAYLAGRHHLGRTVYQDLITAKNAVNNMTLCKHNAYGVLLKPLVEFNLEPDIVIIVTNPYNAMRILQGYSYKYGIHSSYKMSGYQAVCSECTAYPFENNDINVSMLCAGTRNRAGWRDNETGVGFPFNRFINIVDGIYETINLIEPNRKKDIIIEKLKNNSIHDFDITYDTSYWLKKQYYKNNNYPSDINSKKA